MGDSIIDKFYEDNDLLVKVLVEKGEISLWNNVDSQFRKTLVLYVASYFESMLKDIIIGFARNQSRVKSPLVEFIKNKAVARQYHTYFDWESRNANSFFGLFGNDFKVFITKVINSDSKFDNSIKAFLELGQLRNQLVHNNFAIFPLDKTTDEIYGLYKDAKLFLEIFSNKLNEYVKGLDIEITGAN